MHKVCILLVVSLLCSTAYCCSTFCLIDGEQVICGRNMDFHVDGGVIIVCPKGIAKVSMPPNGDMDTPGQVQWTSRYSSLTFNFAARELPASGINECGLVVNEMTLTETVYPPEDDRPALVPLQWIQYQLDCCATVEEVLATDEEIRVTGFSAFEGRGHHFLVSDSSGTSATIEFIDGKRVVHRGKSLQPPALTNNTYRDSSDYLSQHSSFGGDKPIRLGPASKDRFVCLAEKMQRYELVKDHVDIVHYGFESLGHVAAGKSTVWSIVYDATNQQVYYRTASDPRIRKIDAKRLFNEFQYVKMLGIDNGLAGDVTGSFVDYTTERNLEYINQFFIKFNQGNELNDGQRFLAEQLSKYPESFKSAFPI